MNTILNKASGILDEFETEIAQVKASWEHIAQDNPHFEQVSPEHWQETYHRMWLHAATTVTERNELTRWLYADIPLTKIARSPAEPIYARWRKWIDTSGITKGVSCFDWDFETKQYIEKELTEPGEASKEKFTVAFLSNSRFFRFVQYIPVPLQWHPKGLN